MKRTKLLLALLPMFTGVSLVAADTDELGATPKYWYKFDGNLNSSGARLLTELR